MALSELAVITVASTTLKQTGAAMSYFQTSEQCHKWWRLLFSWLILLCCSDWEAARINHLAALGAAGWCCGNMSLGACSWVVLGLMGASCSCAMSGVTFVRMEFECSCCYYLNSYRSALCVCEGAVQLMGFSSFKNPISRNMISSGQFCSSYLNLTFKQFTLKSGDRKTRVDLFSACAGSRKRRRKLSSSWGSRLGNQMFFKHVKNGKKLHNISYGRRIFSMQHPSEQSCFISTRHRQRTAEFAGQSSKEGSD